MNYLKFVFALLLIGLIVSCTKNDLIKDGFNASENYSLNVNATSKGALNKLEKPVQPFFQTKLPYFSAIVLHILQREYAHLINEGRTSLNQGEYLEKRLIELYPEKTFKGIFEQAKTEMDKNIASYEYLTFRGKYWID